MTRTLDWLLDPLTTDDFIEDLWDQRPQLIEHRDRHYFDDLFRAADFDHVLEYSQPKPPSLAVVKTGETQPSVEYVQKDGRLDLNQLRYFYSEGYTLIINGLEKFWGPVAELLQEMMRRLSFRVEANAYLTPRNSKGLRAHYDTHNVFVAQLAGRKTWSLYHEEEHFPRTDWIPPSPFPRDRLGEPTTIDVTAGDVLFVPRGWIHEAETGDESSLHLTLGVYPPLWHEVLAKSLEALTMRHDKFRAALPVGFLHDAEVSTPLAPHFDELLQLVAGESSVADVMGMLQDEFVRLGRSAPDGQMISDLDRLDLIDDQTKLVRRQGVMARVAVVDDSIALQFARSLVSASLDHRHAMTFLVATHHPFVVSELPGLPADDRIALARRLVRDGLLKFVSD